MQKTFNKNGYNIVETNPELEENSSIQNLWKNYKHQTKRSAQNKAPYFYHKVLDK